MPETNPLVAERKDTTTPLAGTFLLEDGEALVQAINDKDWVAGGLAVVGGAFDAAAAASDPIGTLIAMGLGWVLDHVQPFNTWLEQLTGDADQVTAHATTWKNVQKHLQATAETMASHITTDLADMNGRTITAYQGAAGDMTQAINAAGTWAGAIGTALDITAFIVQFVHDFVRDAISEVVGSILSYAAELIATVGLAWPIVAEQIATRIASLIGQVGRNVKNLVTSARNLVKKLTDLKSLFHTLKNKLDDLFKKLHKTDTPTTPTKGPTPTTGGNTNPHGDTGSTSGSSRAGTTSPPSNNTHPSGTNSGSATPTTSPGHTAGNTNPTSGANTTGTTSSATPTSGANTPTHTDGSHTTMTADNAPSTNNSTTHPSSTTGPDGPSGHTTDNPNPTQTGHTTGEPDTPKRALDEDPTTRSTDPVTAEPRHADEPPETSSGGGGDDGNNHGDGGDDHNNHGDGGDDHNNHHGSGDDTDPELEKLRSQSPETIDDVRQVNEELPSNYDGEHAEIGKALDDGYGLIDDPTHHFGTNPETDLPNSYNDWAEKYRRNETDCYWPESSPDSPVTNGMNSGSIENEYKIDNYIEKYGDRIDRIGDPGGKYFGAIEGDHVSSFSERSIDPRSACKPYYQYKLTGYWPEGYRIETGIVAPWHDSPGGARQVQIYDEFGRTVSAEEALNQGILEGDANYDGLH